MKIAATITDCIQVGMDSWRDVSATKVFDSSEPINDILAWAKTKMPKETPERLFQSLKFSVVEE